MAIKIGTIEVTGVAVGETLVDSVAVGSNVVWQRVLPDPLCFTGTSTDSVRMTKVGSPDSANIEYSKDGSNWTAYTFGTWIDFDGTGNKVYFRAASDNNTSFYTDASNYYRFELDENSPTTVSGNIDTLLNKKGTRHITKSRAYRELFSGMSGLTDASQLEFPSDTMTLQCYYGTFQNCTSLSSAPVLPATSLGASCYRLMFQGCSSLTTAPELPATTLAANCYQGMFQGCSSLTTAPELPATTLSQSCYTNMFRECTSLATAPELPATTLAVNCYQYMFYGCTRLSSITVGFSDWQAANTPTTSWVYGVAASGEFYCPSELSVVYGASNIPTGWTKSNI